MKGYFYCFDFNTKYISSGMLEHLQFQKCVVRMKFQLFSTRDEICLEVTEQK